MLICGEKCKKTCKDLAVEASQPGQSLAQQSALFAPTGEFILQTSPSTFYKTNNINRFTAQQSALFAPTGDGQLHIVSMVSGHQQQEEAEHPQQHQYHQHLCHLLHPLIPDVFLASFICLFVC